MKDMNSDNEQYFGAPIDQYPEPCRACPRMAELVLETGNPNLAKIRPYPLRETAEFRMARAIFPLLDKCTDDECGLEN